MKIDVKIYKVDKKLQLALFLLNKHVNTILQDNRIAQVNKHVLLAEAAGI